MHYKYGLELTGPDVYRKLKVLNDYWLNLVIDYWHSQLPDPKFSLTDYPVPNKVDTSQK